MMRRFFEGQDDYDESSGIRNVPFWHHRKRSDDIWETIPEDDPKRDWFRRRAVKYVYGFGYIVGPTSPSDLSGESAWMRQQLADYEEVPPIVVMTVGWDPETFEPYTVPVFSDTFPEHLADHLRTILPTVDEGEGTTASGPD